MAANKTTETNNSILKYTNGITDEAKRKDCLELIALMQKQTGFEPKMWGAAIVGFGSYHYIYESGREGDAPLAALSARANAITLYLADYDGREQHLQGLGKYKTGKGCIYIQKMKDINTDALSNIINHAVAHRRQQHKQ